MHNVFEPKESNGTLAFYIHGLGGTAIGKENEFTRFFTDKGVTLVTVRGTFPVSPGYEDARRWFTQIHDDDVTINTALESLQQLALLIDRKSRDFEPDKVVVVGFSQGGTLAITLPLVYPGIADVFFCFSGYIIRHDMIPPFNPEQWVHMPKLVWAHGVHDDDNMYYLATKGVTQLKEQGADIQFVSFEGGHYMSQEGMDVLATLL